MKSNNATHPPTNRSHPLRRLWSRLLLAFALVAFAGSASAAEYSQNFDSFPDGTTVLGDGSQMNGTASVQGGQLRLTTDGVAGGFASFIIPAVPNSSAGWTATFDLTIIDGPGANPPADGMSFNYGNFGLGELGSAEEGMSTGAATENVSFEIDTWMNFDGEQGVNIAQNAAGVNTDLAFTNGPILDDGTTVSGQVTVSWNPTDGASFETTGLLTNAAFSNVATTFAADDALLFGFSGRVGGANETKLIDNLVITTGSTLLNGLVNYWCLDGHLEDVAHTTPDSASTVADDGTFAGQNGTGGISFAPGLFGQGTLQDGAAGPNQNNGFVDIPRSGDTLFGATTAHTPNHLTTSAWVQVGAFDQDWQALIAHGEGQQYRIARRGNTNTVGYAGGVGEGPAGAVDISVGWHHIVAISDGTAGQTRLYVDGVLDSTGGNPNINDGQGGGTLNLNIGANPNSGGQNREFSGQIDDVAQWNRVLTQAEIDELFGGGPGTAVALKDLLGGPGAPTLGAGFDLFTTPAGSSHSDIDFDGPGPEPPVRIEWEGRPIGELLGPVASDTDTIVQRLDSGAPEELGQPATVPIELIALSLQSVEPVDIGGTLFDATVIGGSLLGHSPSSPGQMDIFRDDANGGTYDATLPVQATIFFSEAGNPTNSFSVPFQDEFTIEGAPWSRFPGPGYPHAEQFPSGGFHPGVVLNPDTHCTEKVLTVEEAMLAAHGVLPAMKTEKWVQLPQHMLGENIPSDVDWRTVPAQLPVAQPNWVLADDFRSDGRPIAGVSWWGSYFDPEDAPRRGPDGQYSLSVEDTFVISFFSDIPATKASGSRPGNLLGTYILPKEKVWVQPTDKVGWDEHPLWQYQIDLADAHLEHASALATQATFNEIAGDIYWISIVAADGHELIEVAKKPVYITAPVDVYKLNGGTGGDPGGGEGAAPSRFSGPGGNDGIRAQIQAAIDGGDPALNQNTHPDTLIAEGETPNPAQNDQYRLRVNGEFFIDNCNGIPNETIDLTFILRNDDGGQLRIFGQSFTGVAGDGRTFIEDIDGDGALTADFFTGNTNALGHISLVEGTYQWEGYMFEGGGGSRFELQAAAGTQTGFNGDFFIIDGNIPESPWAFVDNGDPQRETHFWGWHTSPDAFNDTAVGGNLLMPGNDWVYTNWEEIQPQHNDLQDMAFQLFVGTGPEICVTCLPIGGAGLIADSVADFGGTQGLNGWSYGYYDITALGGPPSSAGDFIAFPNDGGPHSPTNFWNGAKWDWTPGNVPWTEVNPAGGHPNGTNNGVEHWATRRYQVQPGEAGDLQVDWNLAAQNLNGSGTTLNVLHNGVLIDTGAASTGAGITGSVVVSGAQVGDWIDLALSPVGVDANPSDGSDGSIFGGTITRVAVKIASGSTTPVDYGVACAGEDPICKYYVIENSGDQPLTLGTLSVPSGYSVVGSVPSSIPAGGEATIKIQFDATGSLGVQSGTVSLANNDSNEDPYTWEVTAILDTPPVIHNAKDIVTSVPAGELSDPIDYMLSVWDNDEGATVVCDPMNFSQFEIGIHDVWCVATDINGKTSEAHFQVIVLEIQDSPFDRSGTLLDVSLRGEAAPGPAPGTVGGIPAGATLLSYTNAFLNNSEDVLMLAAMSGAGTNNLGVFSNASGSLESLGVKNSASPAGPDYLAFKELSLADDGVASFTGRTTAGDSHESLSGSATTMLVGSPPPGLAGAPLVGFLHQPALSRSGILFSPANLRLGTGSPAVTGTSDSLIWSAGSGLVAREGDPAADLPVGIDYGHLFKRVVANDDAQIAFAGNLRGGPGATNAALWSGPPASLTVYSQKGDTAPGTGGALFNSFQAESISPTGTVVNRASLKLASGVVTSANNSGLWSDRSGSLELVVREDDLAPCLPPGSDARFDRFEAMFIDSGGDIVFYAFLKGTAVSSANDGSVWRSRADGSLHLIAREGDLANNTDGGVYANINVAAANDTGGVLIYARLVTGIGETVTGNNIGIWRDNGTTDPAPVLVIRKSDTLEVGGLSRTVTGLFVDYVTNAAGGTGGYGRVLNDSGTAVMRLSLIGVGAGVFTLPSEIPE